MWPSLISKAKEGGLDVIESYAFWNQHEPKPGQVKLKINCLLSFDYLLALILIF